MESANKERTIVENEQRLEKADLVRQLSETQNRLSVVEAEAAAKISNLLASLKVQKKVCEFPSITPHDEIVITENEAG